MEIYGLTDRGLVREVNEDCIGITCLKNGITIAVVCDGMGGAAGGKIASEIGESTRRNDDGRAARRQVSFSGRRPGTSQSARHRRRSGASDLFAVQVIPSLSGSSGAWR